MRIRRAVTSDFHKAASISVAAFAKDEIYQHRYPYSGEQQASFRGFFLRGLKLRNVLPGYITWVAVTTEIQDLKDGAPDQEVDPVYQRRGVGAKLISWGLAQAELEKVPVTLNTSTVAEPLYRRMGFKTFQLMDLPGIRMGVPSLIRWPSVPENSTEAGSRTG
ncbi:MAG: hypothetical protein LQ339_005276 [Xanthoria mediterranea]|nr:MAG: hypothetical protein LQ339_005276 [Xanthoria mediterranea]